MKLSPKQKEIIRLMREGFCLTVDEGHGFAFYFRDKHGDAILRIHHSTSIALIQKSFISPNKLVGNRVHYTLTNLGKTIEIGEVKTEIKNLK